MTLELVLLTGWYLQTHASIINRVTRRLISFNQFNTMEALSRLSSNLNIWGLELILPICMYLWYLQTTNINKKQCYSASGPFQSSCLTMRQPLVCLSSTLNSWDLELLLPLLMTGRYLHTTCIHKKPFYSASDLFTSSLSLLLNVKSMWVHCSNEIKKG